MPTSTPEQHPYTLEKTAMFASEIFIPGSSNLICGNIGSGIVHLAVASVVTAALLPTMPFLATIAAIGVRLNSYQHATTGNNLWTNAQAGLANLSRRPSNPA